MRAGEPRLTDYEVRRQRREREHAAGVEFNRMLREKLEADTPTLEDLMRASLGPSEADREPGGDDAT